VLIFGRITIANDPGRNSELSAKYKNLLLHIFLIVDLKYSLQCVNGQSGPNLSLLISKLRFNKKSPTNIDKLS